MEGRNMGEKQESKEGLKWFSRFNEDRNKKPSDKEVANMTENDFRSLLLEMEHR